MSDKLFTLEEVSDLQNEVKRLKHNLEQSEIMLKKSQGQVKELREKLARLV